MRRRRLSLRGEPGVSVGTVGAAEAGGCIGHCIQYRGGPVRDGCTTECECVCVCICVCACMCVHVCVCCGLDNSLVTIPPGLVSVITAGRCPEVASRGPGLQKRRARAPGAQRERATDEGHDPTPEIESSRQAGGTGVRRVKRREMNDNNALDHVAGKE